MNQQDYEESKEQEFKDWEQEQEHQASESAKAIADLEAQEQSEARKLLLTYAMLGTMFREQHIKE